MAETLRLERRAGVLSVCLSRPQHRNALSLVLLAELERALTDLAGADVTAVVVCGDGGTFSAGGDFADLAGTVQDLALDEAIGSVTARIRALPVPVIAAIDGPCMGGAVDLALSCDLRIASAGAFFQVPATRLGLLYNPAAVARLAGRVGRDTAFRLLVLGERIDAATARDLGLVSTVVPGPALEAAVAIAEGTARNVPAAVAATKALLSSVEDATFDAADWEPRRRQLLSSPERRAAIEAERQRRLR